MLFPGAFCSIVAMAMTAVIVSFLGCLRQFKLDWKGKEILMLITIFYKQQNKKYSYLLKGNTFAFLMKAWFEWFIEILWDLQ